MKNKNITGFTLIEVLLALAVVSIALTALLMAISQNIANTNRIKEKTISHWVAMQGITMIQLGLLQIPANQEITQVTSMLGERWYWRAKTSSFGPSLETIQITLSQNQAGPFTSPLLALRYKE